MSDQNQPLPDPTRVQNRELTRIGEDIMDCFASLKEMEVEDIFKMPEPVFVLVFLPLFAGETVTDKKVNIQYWCDIVGGGYKEVAVVDEKDDTKELFRVPPVKNQDFVHLAAAQEGGTFAQILAMRRRYASIHPNQGQAYFDQEMAKKDMFGIDPNKLLEDGKRWDAIFTRYGRPSMFDKIKAVSSAGKTDMGEITDYDL